MILYLFVAIIEETSVVIFDINYFYSDLNYIFKYLEAVPEEDFFKLVRGMIVYFLILWQQLWFGIFYNTLYYPKIEVHEGRSSWEDSAGLH